MSRQHRTWDKTETINMLMNVLYSILPPIKLRVKGYPFSIKNASGMSGAGVGVLLKILTLTKKNF